MTLALFLCLAGALVWVWNRSFEPVPLWIAALFFAVVSLYEATTLFTARVEVPGGMAAVVYPWKAHPHEDAWSNTGIIPTQIVPWTRVARDAIRSGEWPLWNRYSAAGAPLLANQQTAIFHPFTLAGLFVLSIGKAFTLSVCLRLFTLLFFTYVFMRGNRIRDGGAIFGAVAYTFCTFHVVWLLFPLGLATMMLPVALTGIQQVVSLPRFRSFVLLTIGLGSSVLGGHPESAFWVWVVVAAYAAFRIVVSGVAVPYRVAAVIVGGFIAAAALTAFVWMPTVALLPHIARTSVMRSSQANPPNHELGPEWLEILIAPNLLGTSQTGTWSGPGRHLGGVLDDYGEMASGYAGIVTLILAAYALIFVRRREKWFFAALLLFSLLTIAEAPWWRDVLRAIPIVGLTLHQRLRIVWVLGAVGLAALAIDSPSRGTAIRVTAAMTWLALVAVYVASAPPAPVAWTSFAITSAAAAIFIALPGRGDIAALVTLFELFAVTYRYNPSAAPRDMLPRTGAIRAMNSSGIGRIAALGWALLPDTPAYFGLEDVKSTDPVGNPAYKRLMHGFLHVVPSYDEIIGDLHEPFVDFLNIVSVYVPPDTGAPGERFAVRYLGADGGVYTNTRALPRYFVPARFRVNATLDLAIPRLKEIHDFAAEAVVDHVPERIARAAPHLVAQNEDQWRSSSPAQVAVLAYLNNATRLRVTPTGWALLASSDTNWPGWRAYVDGRRQPTVTVNGAFLGVFIPPGPHVVEFRYRPASFDLGLRTSAGFFVLIVVAASLAAWRRRSRIVLTRGGRSGTSNHREPDWLP